MASTMIVKLKYSIWTTLKSDEGFDEILIPQNEDAKIYPYAFLIEDSILIAMTEEDDNSNEC